MFRTYNEAELFITYNEVEMFMTYNEAEMFMTYSETEYCCYTVMSVASVCTSYTCWLLVNTI